MTMKMMINTSKMSMSGTTFGVANAPWLSPTSIPIASLLWARGRASPLAVGPRRVGSGAVRTISSANEWQTQFDSSCSLAAARRSSIRRRTRSWRGLFHLLRQQTKLIDSSRADLVHNRDDVTILCASIAPDEHRLVQTAGDAILDLTG